MAWSVSVELRDMPRYYRLRPVTPRHSRNTLSGCCPCRSQARTIPFVDTISRLFLATLVMAHDKDASQRQAKQEKPVIRRDKVVVTKVTEQEFA